jgi:molecular chaperone DnaK
VYAAERLVKDSGDKLPAADKQAIESTIEDLKKAIERNDAGEMKRLLETLNQAQHKAAEAMYRGASAGAPGANAGGTGPGPETGGPQSNADVIDAEVVEEEKK